jgi:serine/threonine protein phosphatase PrpC
MTTHFFGLTDTGKTRGNNEDSFVAEAIGGKTMVLAAVIDGVGGYHGGEVAAEIAKEEFTKSFTKPSTAIIPKMITAFKQANEVILKRKNSDPALAEMACVATLVIADIENNQFYYAHVGDTRLYLFRDGSLVKISKDHSFVGFLEDSGRLNENEAMSHPKRNEINKAIGFSDHIETDESYIETGQSPFLPGDLLLLCSDGLTDLVDRDGIISMISQSDSLEKKASNLVNLANENGGRDNITVVLVQNHKKPKTSIPSKSETFIATNSSTKETIVTAVEDHHSRHTPPKRSYGFTALIILCLILLGTTLLLFFQNQQKPKNELANIKTVAPQRNSQEQLLQDAFNHATGDTLVLSDSIFKSPIMISDTLNIKRDSLFIIGKGIILQADSNYRGAALLINAQNKITGLDSVQFKGFTTAIILNNTKLSLIKVSFINCLLPVQNSYLFQNQAPMMAEFGVSIPNYSFAPKNSINPSRKP